jgi:hypothetical protein
MLKLAKVVWWLLLAYIPFEVHSIASSLSMFICPPGDCYNFAALARHDLDDLYVFTAVVI